MENSFKDTKIIMTGGSGGIGSYVASQLLDEGAVVLILSRRSNVPARAVHISGDLSTIDGIAHVQEVIANENPDVLINLAGVPCFGMLEDQTLEDIHQNYLINLVAPVSLCQACLPAMKARNSGHIVNVGSMMGSIPVAFFASYSSAKSGLRAFSEALRRELAGSAIAVTHVSPRAVKTPFLTPEIEKYIELTKMNIDDARLVAAAIVDAIKRKRKELFIGFPESVFVRLNALAPRLIDRAVAKSDQRARAALPTGNSQGSTSCIQH
jgi:short-subunit dehydrogenase